MWPIGLCIVTLVIIWVTNWIHRWRNPRCNGTLPPGTLGFPFIGETIQFFIPGHSLDLLPFFKKRVQRLVYRHPHLPLGLENILIPYNMGRPVAVAADPEVNHFILQEEGKSVEMFYLDSIVKLFGKDGASTHATGHVHKYLRTLVMNYFGFESLRDKLLPKVEAVARKSLDTWSSQPSVELNYAISQVMFEFISMELFSYDPSASTESMSDAFINFLKGLVSIPLNIPGTTFHKCLKNQKKVMKMLREIVEERCASPERRHGDVLDYFLEEMKSKTFITKDFIVYIMFGLLFATFESIPTMFTLVFKLIMEHPLVWQELKDEHEAILRNSQTSNSTITWEDYKSMTFTFDVINEALRMGNISLGSFRRAVEDVRINGYTIPAGWIILVVPSALHMDPETYPDPLVFNPWRWKEDGGSKIRVKNFTPFGRGIRSCPGAELSKLVAATFIHAAVTKYRFTKIKGGRVVRNPMLKFKDGFYVKVSEMVTEGGGSAAEDA
ncbi:Cytochrome P450 87A3 [Vitis vinifera]|uniref:Cytochrome P450 87A3 n=1 Tax=Vitis vinifera TaxID=29760 RepID=A0A438GEW7_VITVI|nr:Cytochrome P450 87A3 [Vitis vinifera]